MHGGEARRQRRRLSAPLAGAGDGPQKPLARDSHHDRIAERCDLVEPPQKLQVVIERLAEPDARIDTDPGAVHACLGDRVGPLLEKRRAPRKPRRGTAGCPASCGVPRAYASGTPVCSAAATTSTIRGSPRSAETSLTKLAPAASAASATSAFIVSIEIGTSVRPAIAEITGITRRSSSSRPTGCSAWPGRLAARRRADRPRRRPAPGRGRPRRRAPGTLRRPRTSRE